jgi:outer membrane protein OmpA-like peptidoglycan-associated protein
MKATFRPAVVAICFICSISTLADQQQADVVDSDEIADALTEPRTRGLTRGIGVRAKGKVDLNIPFDVDSSELGSAAQKQLRQLLDALSRDSLADFRFQIAGHTDASGADDYNRQLSERRANAVMQYLIENGVDPRRLVAVGYGEDMPLVTDNPRHSDNRRVEIRNLGASAGN